MTIVIPMAGLSQRFLNHGFTVPKYMLYAKDKSLFTISVCSFEKYFKDTRFLFIIRDIFDSKQFVEIEANRLGIRNFEIVVLDGPTLGQADTVNLGLQKAEVPEDDSILIFNIDTFRPGFELPKNLDQWKGYLEVFIGEGDNWSYAATETPNSTKVIKVAEKVQISNYCSTGIYFFASARLFKSAFEKALESYQEGELKELYVAPLYNDLIAQDKEIHIEIIERSEVIFCGIPQEYFDYLKTRV